MSATTTATGSAAIQGELWSEGADDWADLMEPTEAPLHLAGLDQLAVGPGVSLLDVGCGSGAVLRIAADRGADVTGIDASPALAAHARLRVPGSRVEVGDIQFLPFEDGSFDVVTGFNSFQYAADRTAALREARRVLRTDGRVLMAVWGRPEQCDGETVIDAVRALLPTPASTHSSSRTSPHRTSSRTNRRTFAPGPRPARASWRCGRSVKRRSTRRSSPCLLRSGGTTAPTGSTTSSGSQ